MVQLWREAKRALANRKGVTALEYAVVMAAIAPVIVIAYQSLAVQVGVLLTRVISTL